MKSFVKPTTRKRSAKYKRLQTEAWKTVNPRYDFIINSDMLETKIHNENNSYDFHVVLSEIRVKTIHFGGWERKVFRF